MNIRRHWQYLKYVLRHKWFVYQAGVKLGVPRLMLILHDWTKFLPREWSPYVQFFYGGQMDRQTAAALNYDFPVPDDIELRFEIAWNHHQKRNQHHWQYWVRLGDNGTTRVLPMPDVFLREMVADWMGAGRALGKPDTPAWYEANKEKMQLHDETRFAVETLLTRIRIGATDAYKWPIPF